MTQFIFLLSLPVSLFSILNKLFLVKEKRPVAIKSIEEVKDEIKMKLENVKTEQILKEWIEGLKDQAYISIRES